MNSGGATESPSPLDLSIGGAAVGSDGIDGAEGRVPGVAGPLVGGVACASGRAVGWLVGGAALHATTSIHAVDATRACQIGDILLLHRPTNDARKRVPSEPPGDAMRLGEQVCAGGGYSTVQSYQRIGSIPSGRSARMRRAGSTGGIGLSTDISRARMCISHSGSRSPPG